MIDLNYLRRMFRWAAWANRRTLAALRSCPIAQAEALPLLAHVLAAEHVWLSRLSGEDPRVAVWPDLSPDECETLLEENARRYQEMISAHGEGLLVGTASYSTSSGQAYVTPRIDILTHVVVHGPYHRGQVAKILGRAGGPATNTDFITFVREAEPLDPGLHATA